MALPMHLLLLYVLGVASWWVTVEAGVQLGAAKEVVIGINGTSYKAQSPTVRFTESDSSYTFSINDEHYIIQTQPEIYSFSTVASKYGPENIYIYEMRACATDAFTDINVTTEVYIPAVDGSRRLLWDNTEQVNKQQARGGPQRSLLCADGDVCDITSKDVGDCTGLIISGGIGITLGHATGLGSNCDSINSAVNSKISITQLKAAVALEEARKNFTNALMTVITDQQGINSYVNQSIASVQKNLLIQSQTNDQFTLALIAQSQSINDNFLKAQEGIKQIGIEAAASIVSLNAATDAKLIAIQNNTQNAINSLVSQINSTIALINGNQNRNDRSVRELARALRQFQNDVNNGLAGTNSFIDHDQLGQIWNALSDAESRGRVPMIDPSFPGTEPVAGGAVSKEVARGTIEDTYINFVNVTTVSVGVTVTRIHQFRLTFYANLGSLVALDLMGGSWEEIQDLIGAPGCLQGLGPTENAAFQCHGWLEITHTYCTRPGSFTWEDFTQYNGAGQVTTPPASYALTSTICGAVPTVDSVWNGRRVDSVADLHAFLGAVANSNNLVTDTHFQIVSLRGIPIAEVLPDYSPDVININPDAMFRDGTITTPTLPYVMYTNWQIGLTMMVTQRNRYIAALVGVRPRGFTNTLLPFYGLPNGHSYTCYQTSITTFDPATQIFYRVTPTGVTPRVTIKVYDAESILDCSVSPCLVVPQGNLKRTITPNSIDISTLSPRAGDGVYDPSVLPQSSSIMFGELSAGTMSAVFDIPSDSANLAPNARSRAGHVDYTSWPFPSDYSVTGSPSGGPPVGTLPQWESSNPGQLYDHEASVSAGFYRHPVSTATGKCIPVNGVPFQKACTLLDNFVVEPSTNMRAGVLALSPRRYTVTVNFDAIDGPIEVRVTEGCPETSFDANNIRGRVLILTNSLPYDISAIVVRTNINPACPTADVRVTIAAKGIEYVPFASCGNYTAQVYSVPADSTATPTLCGSPITAALQASTQENLAIGSLINATALVVNNQFQKGLANSDLNLISLILGVVSQVVPGVQLTIQGYDFSTQNVSALVNNLLAAANGIDLTSNSASDAIAPFLAQLAILRAESNATLVELNQAQSALSDAIDAQNNYITSELVPAFNTLNAKSDEFIGITNNLIAGLEASQRNNGFGSNRGCATLGFLDRMICTIETMIEWAAYIAVGALLVYGFLELFKFLKARSSTWKSKPSATETQSILPTASTKGRIMISRS